MNALFFLVLLTLGILSGIPATLLAVETSEEIAKAEEVADLEKGLWFERKDSGFFRLDIEKNKLRAHFFDEDKQPVKPDLARVIGHFTPRHVSARQTVLFRAVEGEDFLEAPRFIPPPFHFNLIVVLVFDESGERTESYAGRILPKHEVEDKKQVTGQPNQDQGN